MNQAIKYLRKKEWSMGNGQCPECCACHSGNPGWVRDCDHLGHNRSCKLAKSLVALGEKVEWRHANKSPERKAAKEHWAKICPPITAVEFSDMIRKTMEPAKYS